MPIYIYEALNSEGSIVTGKRKAELLPEVEDWLIKNRMSPLNIKIASGKSADISISSEAEIGLMKRLTGVSLDDRILLCRQIATMLDAGVAILQTLSIMSKQTDNPVLRKIIAQIAEDIENGDNLSDAFGRYPREFNTLFQNIVRIGEESGGLEVSFEYLARVFENEKDVNEKIKSATRYPKIVIVGLFSAVVFLMIFVMPKFIGMFSRSNIELPLPTRILIGTSNIFSEHYLLLGAGLAIIITAYHRALKSKDFVRFRDRLILKIPVLGVLSIKIYMSRFCRVFAVLSKSGIDIIKTLKLSATSLDNLVLYEIIEQVTTDVERGIDLYDSMSKHQLFPGMVIQMVSIGEESGTLDIMMDKVADYYEVETDYTIKSLSTLIEPVLLLFMGGMVALLALAIYMPMWNMMNVMR